MKTNLSRGLWRLWLFFTLIWVGICGYQAIDAAGQVRKAQALLTYYKNSVVEAQKLESVAGISPLVVTHLNEQVSLNEKLAASEHARGGRFFLWAWSVPLAALLFARGVPWVVEGFAP
jgi:hypothetical protein